ncbi:MAG: hypothetical protein E7422_08245 [Ruminococcaceae bacterium]|nr:hypothetical protein [Oscillospiraceae bacterium]
MGMLLFLTGLLGTGVSVALIVIKAIKKQPKKNAIIAAAVCFVLFIVGCVFPSGDKDKTSTPPAESSTAVNAALPKADAPAEEVPPPKEETPAEAAPSEEVPPDESVEAKFERKVKEYISNNYSQTVLDRVTINPDLGTDADGDYIALVYLTWNVKNKGQTSKDMLTMYSEDMAVRVYDDMPEIQELAVFWTVPYLNNGSAKLSFERNDKGMAYTDKVFDSNFN